MSLLSFVPSVAGFAVWIVWGVAELELELQNVQASTKARCLVQRVWLSIAIFGATIVVSTLLHAATLHLSGMWGLLDRPGYGWSGGYWPSLLLLGLLLSPFGFLLGGMVFSSKKLRGWLMRGFPQQS